MRKLTRCVLIAGTGVVVILSGVDGADVMGQAHADEPQCIANATAPCPQQVDKQQADLPKAGPLRPRTRVFCQPAGPMAGTHCFQRLVP